MQRSKARGPDEWVLLSLFCFPVFALGLGCFPELRLFRAVVDLLVGGSARFPARVFVQVVEHLAQDRLEGAVQGELAKEHLIATTELRAKQKSRIVSKC